MYKYLEIFRKTLSGTPGKNLTDMSFVNQDSTDMNMGKGLLNRLRKTELSEDALLDGFFDRIIDTYNYVGSFLILLIYQSYDIPGITSDGIELDDASDEVYNFVLCSICPMKLTKPGLGYDDEVGEIHTLKQIFAVELPDIGFMYPAFNDRSTDDSALLYSCRKVDLLQDAFLENVLGVSATLPAKQQKEGFKEFVTDVLGDESSLETVLSIQENLKETVSNRKSESAGETVFLDKESVRNVFEKSGVSKEKLDAFDKKFDEQFDMKKIREKQVEAEIENEDADVDRKSDYVPTIKVEEKLFADNVAPIRNFEVRNKNMVLRVSSKHTDIIDTRMIDGKKCLVIELTDDLTVNGIPVGAERE